MSSSPQIIYSCNHIITDRIKLYSSLEVTRNVNTNYPDKLQENIDIIRIDKVYDNNTIYTRDIDYTQMASNNIIEWTITGTSPLAGEKYYIDALYSKTITEKFEDSECTRCGGNGWYVDLFSQNGSVNIVENESKLAQDFIKVLFTDKQSDGTGSGIRDILGINIYNDNEVSHKISEIINSCVTQIKKRQEQNIANGIDIPNSEKLSNVIVNKILFVRSEATYYVTISLVNANNKVMSFSFKV